MRLNWFAPASGPAARAAAAVLPALRRRAEVAVWTGPPDATAWDEINRAAASVCHVGAHESDGGPPWDLLRHHPGVVVLHEHGPVIEASPLLARLAEEAAGVLVHSWPSYAALKQRQRCPVIYRPPPGVEGGADDYAGDLLHLVALVRRNGPAAAGLRLAGRAATGMAVWTSGLAGETAYHRLAEAIHALVA